MKKILAIIVFVAVMCIGGFFAYRYSKNISTPSNANKSEEIKSENISSKEKNEKGNYTLETNYLQFSGIKNKNAETKINDDIKKYVADIITFIKNPNTEGEVDMCNFSNLPGGAPEWECQYDIGIGEFNVVANKILSVRTEYYWFTGGAHGGTNIEFLNYNLETGERIKWQDVFKKGSNYLEVIANYAKTDLTKQLLEGKEKTSDENWIKTGTDPKEEANYKNNIGFNSKPDILKIVFGQYQVAPYSTGMSEVEIPFSQLKDVIDPAGLLGTN